MRRLKVAMTQLDTTEQQKAIQGFSEPLREVRITVYGEPGAKARPRFGKSAVYTSKKTKAKEDTIGLVYKADYGVFRFEKPATLCLLVDAYFKIAKKDSKAVKEAKISGEIRPTKRPDVDNVVKLVMDALNSVAYDDDSQIADLRVRKFYSDDPRVEICLAKIGDG